MLKEHKEDRSHVEHCARIRIQTAIVKATSLCIRSRSYDEPKAEPTAKVEGCEAEDEVVGDLAVEFGDLRVHLGE